MHIALEYIFHMQSIKYRQNWAVELLRYENQGKNLMHSDFYRLTFDNNIWMKFNLNGVAVAFSFYFVFKFQIWPYRLSSIDCCWINDMCGYESKRHMTYGEQFCVYLKLIILYNSHWHCRQHIPQLLFSKFSNLGPSSSLFPPFAMELLSGIITLFRAVFANIDRDSTIRCSSNHF